MARPDLADLFPFFERPVIAGRWPMKALLKTLGDDPVFNEVSPLYRLMGSHRSSVYPKLLVDGLDLGWAQAAGMNEQDPREQRPLMLAYLGTFNPGDQRRADAPVTQDRLDAEALADRALPNRGDPRAVPHRLLDLGADPFLPDNVGRDTLDQVLALQWTSVLDRLLRLDDPRVAPAALAQRLHTVARQESGQGGHPGTTQPGARDQALPWLHAAAYLGRIAVIERLLDHGMDVNQRDAFGRTPLFYVPFDSMVERLLVRGADPAVRDTFGELPNAAWPRFGVSTVEITAMNARFLKAYRAAPGADPEALKDEQRASLFHQATTASSASFQAFLKSHHFTADEVLVVDGRPVSLLATVALDGLNSNDRAPSIGGFLIARAQNLRHETVNGIPDVLLMWLSAHAAWKNAEKAQRDADQAMARTFGWDQPGGLERSLDEVILPVFERLLKPMTATPQAIEDDPGLAWLSQRVKTRLVREGMVKLLGRMVKGEVALPDAAQGWTAAGPRGTSRAWWWAAIVARHHGNMEGMYTTMETVRGMVGGNGALKFAVAPDPDTVQALVGVLGENDRLMPNSTTEECPWGKGTLVSAMHHLLVEQKLPVNTAQPGFAAMLAQLQTTRPVIAQAIERQALLRSMEDGAPAPVRASRARL